MFAGAAIALLGACAPPRPLGPVETARLVRDTVADLLARARADSAFPAAVAIVGTSTETLALTSVGRLDWRDDAPLPSGATIWDLASLTKVVGTTTAAMQLWNDGRLALDTPVSTYLPRFAMPGAERVTVRHLLVHTSGLPAHRPYYLAARSSEDVLDSVYATPLDTVPGARMVYSDLDYILLGEIVQRVSGEPLDAYLEAHVFGPLGMHDTGFRPPPWTWSDVAPTERDPWRGRLVRGEVHDENAYAMGGVSGHAGLFGSARDLARFARMLLARGTLDGVRVLDAAAIDTFTRVQNPAVSHRALGWETPNGINSAGHRMSARAFGHTGFTGVSLWIDPGRDLFVVLLTNRVNPTRANTRILDVRVRLADAVLAAYDAAHPERRPPPPPPSSLPRTAP